MKLQYDPLKVHDALFIGKETEGLLRGLTTLFVVGDVPVETIREHIQKYTHVLALYFGAAGWHTYNKETVETVQDEYPDRFITVESPKIDLELMRNRPQLYWMYPVCWHGKPLTPAINHLHEFLRTEKSYVLERVFVKYDFGDVVQLCRASDLFKAERADYESDQHLYQKELTL